MKPQIRQATIEDAELLTMLNMTVQQLHVEAAPRRYKPTTGKDPDIIAWFHQRLSNENTFIFILETNAEAVGYVVCMVRHSAENALLYAYSLLQVDELCVKREHQRKGYGELLMERAYELAREQNIVRVALEVLDFNQQAVNFYRKLGFEVFNYRMHKFV